MLLNLTQWVFKVSIQKILFCVLCFVLFFFIVVFFFLIRIVFFKVTF